MSRLYSLGQSRTDAELIRIVQFASPGDPDREAAYEELVNRYAPVVRSCARHYLHSPEPQEELIQAGYIGLLTAISNFDSSLGTSLLAYARPCISGEIKRHFRDKRWHVRVRRSAQELRAQLLQAESELFQSLGHVPGDRELAQHMHLDEESIRDARAADQAFRPLSLDAPFAVGAEDGTLGDRLGEDDDQLENMISMEAVWAHFGGLPEREQQIVQLRFYGNMTQAQIAAELGISQMHVSRLLTRSLRYLRAAIEADEPAAAKLGAAW